MDRAAVGLSVVLTLTLVPGFAEEPMHDHSKMAGHGSMGHGMDMNEAGEYLMDMASGTSMNPQSWQAPMLARKVGSWNLMFMGQAYLVDTQQSGPRGGDKLYAPNWFMGSAEHAVGKGALMFQTMLSLDPATVTDRRYPLLFQTGETAYGKPLTDAQHPHDLLMGIGVHYAHPLAEGTILQLYYAPIGDPALGPVAFPHRASAAELPQATLGHHWQDSTHIASNVATVALKRKWIRLEASGFHGTEPNENRWNVDWGPMNSYSGRISVFPAENWMAQFSMGKLTAPERLEEGNVVRTSASLQYTKPVSGANAWSTSIIWGRNHRTRRSLDSFLVETVYPVSRRNYLTGRAESVDKDELFADNREIEHGRAFRIGAYTAGYTRDLGSFKNVVAGVGANITAYTAPAALKPYYGDHPRGVSVYVRFRLK